MGLVATGRGHYRPPNAGHTQRGPYPPHADTGATTVEKAVAKPAAVLAAADDGVLGDEHERLSYPTASMARIQLNKVASTTATTAVGWIVIG